MTAPASTVQPDRIGPLIDKLVETLEDEARALDDLNALLARQLGALRAGTPGVLEDTATDVHECTAGLDTLRQKRARQTRLLRRVLQVEPDGASLEPIAEALRQGANTRQQTRLADARAAVRSRAQAAHERGETLSFAIEYAAELNRDLLLAMQGSSSEGGTYTASGQSQASSDGRSFVNTVG